MIPASLLLITRCALTIDRIADSIAAIGLSVANKFLAIPSFVARQSRVFVFSLGERGEKERGKCANTPMDGRQRVACGGISMRAEITSSHAKRYRFSLAGACRKL